MLGSSVFEKLIITIVSLVAGFVTSSNKAWIDAEDWEMLFEMTLAIRHSGKGLATDLRAG